MPPGLGQLSASLGNLAEFLCIDRDLLHVSAANSQPLRDMALEQVEVREWVGKLASKDKDKLIADLIVHGDQGVAVQLMQRYLAERSPDTAMASKSRRTAGELRRDRRLSDALGDIL